MAARAHTHPSSRTHFMAGDTIPATGSIMRRPELASTLRQIAEGGPEAFYRGAGAERIAAFFAGEGGLITLDDLPAHTSDCVTPLACPLPGLEVYVLPPNTQGGTAL